jgi:hypothetical protein
MDFERHFFNWGTRHWYLQTPGVLNTLWMLNFGPVKRLKQIDNNCSAGCTKKRGNNANKARIKRNNSESCWLFDRLHWRSETLVRQKREYNAKKVRMLRC